MGYSCVICFFLCFLHVYAKLNPSDFLVITVATEETDGFKRYVRSARVYGLDVKVLGMGEKWSGGDMDSVGGGQKVNLVKKELELHKKDKDKIIMFTDSYDVIFTGGADRILEEFKSYDARVLFSAEGALWPDLDLKDKYPEVKRGKRFLCSGGFIGYAPDLYDIISSSPIKDDEDDQLFYTNIYLDEKMRTQHNIKLDHTSKIFQNLNGAIVDVELRFLGREPYVQNMLYSTVPLVIHGNGLSKIYMNTLGNYLARAWNPDEGCVECRENVIDAWNIKKSDMPTVLIGVFIEQATPFLDEFFYKLYNLDYPKDKLHLFIHNSVEYHMEKVKEFVESYGAEYASVKEYKPEDDLKEWHARNEAIKLCAAKKCDYYFNVDAVAHIDNPDTLLQLIHQNRSVVAPLLIRPYKAWSNFWGSLTSDGFYARSFDYMDIVNREKRGLWNVPYISSLYLVNGTLLQSEDTYPSYISSLLDADMAFCQNMREAGVFMFVTNRVEMGHLINTEEFDISHHHPELYEISSNRWDWELRYLVSNYSDNLDDSKPVQQPCPDVYWFPLTTPRFCKEFIEIMENFGKWSDGSSYDARLEGGYESVPTRDIHANQVGFEQAWLYLLKEYVMPLQQRVFEGYFNDPPRAIMNFVVRYKPEEQPELRPHHDSSTYTINMALNRPGIDYQGGGAHFLRYNCSVVNSRVGWLLMHPGRLTHYHQGLPTTQGTRYIMVSFVDP